jgi:hypothetical protein
MTARSNKDGIAAIKNQIASAQENHLRAAKDRRFAMILNQRRMFYYKGSWRYKHRLL